MQINLIKQDIVDAICAFVASQENGGYVQGSRPDLVYGIELEYNSYQGIRSDAYIYDSEYNLNEQGVKDAIGLYLSEYHFFRADSLLINLSFDIITGFSANIIVEK